MKFNSAIFLIIISSPFFGCRNQDRQPLINPNLDSSLTQVTKKFCLPYPTDLRLNGNSMIFYGARTFDTSFLIHIVKGSSEIDGVYYELLPTYHRNINAFATTTGSELLFFEGYSFVLDSAKWEVIKNMIKKIQQGDTGSQKSKGEYTDGETYGLYYDSMKMIKRNGDNIIPYQSFYKFLKDSFLEDFIRKRKPVMQH